MGFATRDLVVNLGLANRRALADPGQYTNSELVINNIKVRLLCNEIATFEVGIPSWLVPMLLLATTLSIYQEAPNLATSIGFADCTYLLTKTETNLRYSLVLYRSRGATIKHKPDFPVISSITYMFLVKEWHALHFPLVFNFFCLYGS